MSLYPDNAYCPDCFGVKPLGQFGRNLKSACKCDEAEREGLTERADLEPKKRPDGRWQVAA